MSIYGRNEYARPIANALENDAEFRKWFIAKTVFAEHADTAISLSKAQKRRRTPSAKNWWQHYYTTKSYAHFSECGKGETDLLAVFKTPVGFQFALHIEIKAPGDEFQKNQAADYPKRAKCWAGIDRAPPTVLPHDEATTVLCCDDGFRVSNELELQYFSTVIDFETISRRISPYPDPC